MSLLLDAKIYACEKHRGMVCPNRARQPVVEHLEEVAQLCTSANLHETGLAAAWLHDVVEDTDATIDEIKKMFGAEVALLVDGLTDPADFAGMPLKERKSQQAIRLSDKSHNVKIIKLCDQISNVKSVLEDPPLDWQSEKSRLYIEGAKELAKVCQGLAPNLDRIFEDLYRRREKYGA